VGDQLKDHATEATETAIRRTEAPLFDAPEISLKGPEKQIHESLGTEPTHADQLIGQTGLPPGTVSAALVALRLKGLIRQLPGNLFARRSR